MRTTRKTLGSNLWPVVLCSLLLVADCSLLRRRASRRAAERETAAAVEQDTTAKQPTPTQARQPARQPTTQARQPARQPATSGAAPSKQPARRVVRRPRTYTPAELEAMASDIASLGNQLTALNRRTTRRLEELTPPDTPTEQVLPADQRYRFAGDYRQMQQLVRQHEDHPEDLATLVTLADLQRRNDKPQEAEAYLLKALALEPLNQEFLFDLGYLYLEKGELTKAWSAFQEIIYLNPESIEAHLAQGLVREKEGNYQGAMTIYAEVEEQFGAVAGVYFHRALNLVGQGDYGVAVTSAREGLTLYPDHAPLYHARGVAYAGLGMLDRAKTDFYDAISLDADLLESYAALGRVSLQEGNAATAIRAYLRLVGERPGDAEASLNLGRAYLMNLRLEEAVQELEMLQHLHPGYAGIAAELCQAYYLYSLELKDQGQFREALELHRKAMSLSGGQPRGWIAAALANAGTAARIHDDYQRSLGYFQLAIENDPFRADSYVGLSLTYEAMRDLSQARAALQRALAIDPHHPAAQVELSRITGP